MNYKHLYRLTKNDLKSIVIALFPHLKGPLYKRMKQYLCTKQDLIGELNSRKVF